MHFYSKLDFKVRNYSQRVETRRKTGEAAIKTKFVSKNGAAYHKISQVELSLTLQMEDLVMLSEVDSHLKEQKFINEDLQRVKEFCWNSVSLLLNIWNKNQEAERMAMTKAGAEIQDLKIKNQNLQN